LELAEMTNKFEKLRDRVEKNRTEHGVELEGNLSHYSLFPYPFPYIPNSCYQNLIESGTISPPELLNERVNIVSSLNKLVETLTTSSNSSVGFPSEVDKVAMDLMNIAVPHASVHKSKIRSFDQDLRNIDRSETDFQSSSVVDINQEPYSSFQSFFPDFVQGIEITHTIPFLRKALSGRNVSCNCRIDSLHHGHSAFLLSA
jgi:hypothetical protein